MANPSTCFCVKSRKLSTIAVYDSYRRGAEGSDYEIFLARDEVKNHPDLEAIKDMVGQILKPQRILTLPGEIASPQKVNEGFLRPETPEWGIPKKLKFENNFVAMPGKKRPPKYRDMFNTGLRLFCLHWDYRTVVLLDGFDKKGHVGSYQSNDRLNSIVQPLLRLFGAIFDALDCGDYSVNEPDAGFVKRKETERCNTVELDDYLQ